MHIYRYKVKELTLWNNSNKNIQKTNLYNHPVNENVTIVTQRIPENNKNQPKWNNHRHKIYTEKKYHQKKRIGKIASRNRKEKRSNKVYIHYQARGSLQEPFSFLPITNHYKSIFTILLYYNHQTQILANRIMNKYCFSFMFTKTIKNNAHSGLYVV